MGRLAALFLSLSLFAAAGEENPAPNSGPVEIRLLVSSQDRSKISKAESLIRELLDHPRKTREKIGEVKGRQGRREIIGYSAPAWSNEIAEDQRKDLIRELLASWSPDIEILSGTNIWALERHAAVPLPAEGYLKTVRAARLDPLLAGRFSAVYDGGLSRPSNGAASGPRNASAESPELQQSLLLPSRPAPGIRTDYMDPSVNPCEDFYHYACGNWLKNNPIPPEYDRWGTFDVLAKKNRLALRSILENLMGRASAADSEGRKLADLYGSCTNKAAIEAEGAKPIEPELEGIAALKSKKELAAEVAHLHQIGVGAFFSFESQQDYQNADRMIAAFDQGGFALPDRDYYWKKDFAKDRAAYVLHIQKMLELTGEPPRKAAQDASEAMAVETALAHIAMDRVSRRDPLKVNHKIKLADLEKTAPSFNWGGYLEKIGAPQFRELNAEDYDFFKGLGAEIKALPLGSLKAYLRWQTVHAFAPALSSGFVDENFAFFGKRLLGREKLPPRWERCVQFVDGDMGEALGKLYVRKHFPPEAKKDSREMLGQITSAMAEDIKAISWMSPETKAKALQKLAAMKDKIGYPERWRDYSKLDIRPGDHFGNFERASAFEFHREINKIGTATDRSEWQMTPPTVNAYYDPAENDMNFPAGILQPPFYDPKADLASNLGAIGAVEGHELTHGFDDEGRLYDAKGDLHDWWAKSDEAGFKKRAQCLVDQYSRYVAAQDPENPGKSVHLNGKLTLGENTADNGGLHLAYAVLGKNLISQPPSIGGLTPEKRFFIAYAQTWCQNQTPQSAKLQALENPHSTAPWRVQGPVSNMAGFAQAFSCPAKSPMINQNACRVW